MIIFPDITIELIILIMVKYLSERKTKKKKKEAWDVSIPKGLFDVSRVNFELSADAVCFIHQLISILK